MTTQSFVSSKNSDREYLSFALLLLRCKQGLEREILESRPDLVNIKLAEALSGIAVDCAADPEMSSHVTSVVRLKNQIIAELENNSTHLKFIHDLVNSDETQEVDLVQKNRHLIGKDFFYLARKKSRSMLENNDIQGRWLLHKSRDLIHRHIINKTLNDYIKDPSSDLSATVVDYLQIVRFEYLEKWTENANTALQAQGNTSVIKILPQLMDIMHTKILSLEVGLAAQSMSVYRPNQPFSRMEQALGLLAFEEWLATLEQMVSSGSNIEDKIKNYLVKANETARLAARSFVSNTLDNLDLVENIRKEFPAFNPKLEVEWLDRKVNISQWQQSLTRSIVMLCRGLAYRYADSHGTERVSTTDPDGVKREYIDDTKSEYLGSLRSIDIRNTAIAMFSRAVRNY
jgi:hypothetical protein